MWTKNPVGNNILAIGRLKIQAKKKIHVCQALFFRMSSNDASIFSFLCLDGIATCTRSYDESTRNIQTINSILQQTCLTYIIFWNII